MTTRYDWRVGQMLKELALYVAILGVVALGIAFYRYDLRSRALCRQAGGVFHRDRGAFSLCIRTTNGTTVEVPLDSLRAAEARAR